MSDRVPNSIQLQTKKDYCNTLEHAYEMPPNGESCYSKSTLQDMLKVRSMYQRIPKGGLSRMRKANQLIVPLNAGFLADLVESLLKFERRSPMGWKIKNAPLLDYVAQCADYLDTNHRLNIWKTRRQTI